MPFASTGLSLMLCLMPLRAPQAPDGAASLAAAALSLADHIPDNGPADAKAAPSGAVAPDQRKSGEANAPAGASPQATSSSTGAGQATNTSQAETKPPENRPTPRRVETWGDFDPGEGFLVARTKAGELSISGYAMVRYINQLPPEQTFTDHLGNEHPVDARQDIFSHRVMVFLKGWLGNPRFIYNIFFWTVNTTDQKAIFGSFGYQFSRRFSLYAGISGLPGTRSIQGSHPYWLAPDRVMADEFFRPYFTMTVNAVGELVPGLWWDFTVGNNNSSLGIKATDLDRKLSYGGSLFWMPTTHEFGPRGAYGDWEMHDKLATRFGMGAVTSPEIRQTSSPTGPSNNTTLRLADSLNIFETDSLAPGVTVQSVDYDILSIDAGVKYRGFFLQAEVYNRWLDNLKADGPLPMAQIHDWGFYVQAAFFPIPHKLEVYAATSQIFGDKNAGFSNPNEYLVGLNYYPFDSRNYRLNAQVIDVNRSPVNSTFGYYTGGQKGTTVSVAGSIFF